MSLFSSRGQLWLRQEGLEVEAGLEPGIFTVSSLHCTSVPGLVGWEQLFSNALRSEAQDLEIDPDLDCKPLLLSSLIATEEQECVFCDSVLFGAFGF